MNRRWAGIAAGALLCLAALLFVRGTEHRLDEVLQALRQTYPNTSFLSVRETPVGGLYAVLMPRNSAFTDAEGRSFIFGGTMVDMHSRQVVEPFADRAAAFAAPEGSAISYVTNEPVSLTVAVFSDIDCPFCIRLERELARIEGLRVDVLLYPVAELHPDAARKSAQIWCSKNPSRMYLTAMLDPASRPELLAGLPDGCPTPIDANMTLGRRLGVHATPMLFAPNGERLPGYRRADELKAWIEARQR